MPKVLCRTLAAIVALTLLAGISAPRAQTYLDLEQQVQEFTLDNGMRFLVLERHEVPVFSFMVYVNAGSANEIMPPTGIAHVLEHMAFKGTTEVGTTDFRKELRAMEAEDAAYEALKAERLKGDRADPDELARLEEELEAAKEAAREFVVSNQFGQIVENNGGQGMNANTGTDATRYFYSFPSNRLELWAYLEGNRICHPVFREFYTEKDGAVTEERRMRTENSPVGMLIEQLQNTAYSAHTYHHTIIGYMDDIHNMTRADCQRFYEEQYVGSNVTVAIVGDVELKEVKRLARKYFSDLPAGEAPELQRSEPKQLGEKRIVIEHTSQPILALAYHIGDINHPDDPVYDAIADILGQGRTCRLHKTLVNEQKTAVQVGVFSGFPGKKYPNLMLVYAIPAKDVTATELEATVLAEVEKLVSEGVTAEELAGVKRRAKADFVRSLGSNQGLAAQLTYFQGMTGDWRDMFRQVDAINAVTPEDVQRVAQEVFDANNRTVAMIETSEEDES